MKDKLLRYTLMVDRELFKKFRYIAWRYFLCLTKYM